MTDDTERDESFYDFRDDADEEQAYANGIIYGAPKTGKTTGAHTAPGRVLYLNWDTTNATLHARRTQTEKGRIREPRLPRFQANKTPVFDLMTRVVNDAYASRWDTIVSDPLSEHYRRLLEEQTNRSRRPTLDARGNAWSDVERWYRSLVQAPVNFIVVAHEMQATKGESLLAIPFVGSQNASQAGFGTKLKGLVDFIAHTDVIETEGEAGPQYVAQLRPGRGEDGASRDAGSRFGALMDEASRPVNLKDWFVLSGVHTSDITDEAGQSTTEAVGEKAA